jgi:eukaryotic-like serine/threonine-protein kinase
MKPEQWQQAREVLADALKLQPEDRSAFLDRACSSDQSLRREVERLLAANDEARSDFLHSSALRITLMPGTKLGDYEIVSLLGSGGMGEVYRARDTRLARDVAIKVLPFFYSSDPDRLRRFEQEARAAAALNHSNILAVFQMGTYEGAPYLVSELLEGSTLREHLVRGPVPFRKAIDIGVQVARGLAAAHEKGIVHRDLKPENLFVTKDGRVKILDFGLAKLVQPSSSSSRSALTASTVTEAGMVMGTVGYMAPEQVRGQTVDHRADVFAFGAILYEMLSGKRAFQKPTSAETMSSILNEDPPGISQLTPSIPPALQRVVHRCLEKNPEQRFQSASDLAFALGALSDSGGLSASAVDAQATSRVRLRPLWWSAVALILLLPASIVLRLLKAPKLPVDPAQWVQITNFPDAVSQPALSPDGHILTFVRGPSTFYGSGQVYIKLLPDGEPKQLTHDDYMKMSPVFSPDGSRIAYTTVDDQFNWDTWFVPALGGEPWRWLPNASGLVWRDNRSILFSEIKTGTHMAVVTSEESRADLHDVYVPAHAQGMAHRSYPSPDSKWALVVEMDGPWVPCRLVPLDGSSPGRQVGPPDAACTFAAWSGDGKWMYFSSSAGGAFHTWRQRFPDGKPEQITSGPTEEEGIAITPDQHSFITAVGHAQRPVILHQPDGERQISLEGYGFQVKFTPQGDKICYRLLKGSQPGSDPTELWVGDMDSGRNEPLLPGFLLRGLDVYDVSPDGTEVVVSVRDNNGKDRLWLAAVDRHSPPRLIPNAEGISPVFGLHGEIFFRAPDGFVYQVLKDGTGLQKTIDTPISFVSSISPDGRWLAVIAGDTFLHPIGGGLLVPLGADMSVGWTPDRKHFLISIGQSGMRGRGAGSTYVIPLPVGQMLPKIPAVGFRSRAEIARLPGVRVIDAADVAFGRTLDVYALSRETAQRNLYKIPLP